VARSDRLGQLFGLGTLNQPATEVLEVCMVAGLNVVVGGGTPACNPTSRQYIR
jgi:hypothetical protein